MDEGEEEKIDLYPDKSPFDGLPICPNFPDWVLDELEKFKNEITIISGIPKEYY